MIFRALSIHLINLSAWMRENAHDLRHYKSRCYCSGAITSRLTSEASTLECEQDFAFIAQVVKRMGYIAVVPLGMCPKDWSYRKIMVHVCWKLLLCRSVYFMTDWQTSKGCRIEMAISRITFKHLLFEESK